MNELAARSVKLISLSYTMALYSTETGLQFDEQAETLENYEERLKQFLGANKIEPDRRRAVFLSVVGPKTIALLKDASIVQ